MTADPLEALREWFRVNAPGALAAAVGPCGCEAKRDPWTRCEDCEARGWSPDFDRGLPTEKT